MSMSPALSARVEVPRVPPSLNDVLGQHWSVTKRIKDELTLADRYGWPGVSLLARSARVRAGWPLPLKDPPAVRWLEIHIYRRRLLDDDNPFVKPLVDCLKGSLIWDDGPAYCALAGKPEQHRVKKASEERTVLVVHLVDPRERAIKREESRRLAEASEERL